MPQAELPSVAAVYVKELAHATGMRESTIRRRMQLWDRDPNAPKAIPYLRRLGRPYRIPLKFARELVGVEGAA